MASSVFVSTTSAPPVSAVSIPPVAPAFAPAPRETVTFGMANALAPVHFAWNLGRCVPVHSVTSSSYATVRFERTFFAASSRSSIPYESWPMVEIRKSAANTLNVLMQQCPKHTPRLMTKGVGVTTKCAPSLLISAWAKRGTVLARRARSREQQVLRSLNCVAALPRHAATRRDLSEVARITSSSCSRES